jgi:hypothetical protein
MENRGNVTTTLLTLAGLFIISNQAVAYSTDTHAFLTQKAVEAFNKTHQQNQIPQELVSFVLDGARREDDPPRPMNHFYDPVKNRGLTQDFAIDATIIPGKWEKSKDWAQSSRSQNSLAYSPVIATILSSIDSGKLQKFLPTSDFTWNEALKYWIQGNKEMALFTLGHILHLVEDASVPDHTRNDPHPGDSPYENYAKRFTTDSPDYANASRNASLRPTTLSDLNSYFIQLATYSNNNFYSKDTIGIQSGYNNPQPDYFTKEGGFSYGYYSTPEKHRIVASKIGQYNYLETKHVYTLAEEEGDLKVMNDYWTLLSKKSIEYSAGVIDLFFKEAEKNKNNPEFLAKKKDFLGQIIEVAQNIFKSIFGDSENKNIILTTELHNENETVPPATQGGNAPQVLPTTPNITPATAVKTSPKPTTSPKASPIPSPHISPKPSPKLSPAPTPKNSPTPTPKTSVSPSACNISGSQTPAYTPVLINEIAWMGTTESSSNEWMELKNVSPTAVYLAGWALKSADGGIAVTFGNISIPAGGYALLERTDDTSVPGIKADIIYTGTLSNTGEQLYLFTPGCGLADTVSAAKWQAGNAESRKTMERNSDTRVWYTSSVVNGTPRSQNSTPSASGGGGPATNPTPTPSPTASPSPSPSPSVSPVFAPIKITEIFYNPEGSDDFKEWIEVQNTGNTPANIEEWRVYEQDTMHRLAVISGSATIHPGEYAIIAETAEKFRTEQYPSYIGTLFDSSFSLNNSGEYISLYNGDMLIDNIVYNAAWGGNGNGNSIQKNGDTWCEGPPTPGAENVCASEPEAGSLALSYNANAPAITAQWDEPLEENEQFQLHDVSDPQHAVLLTETRNEEYVFSPQEVGKEYIISLTATNGNDTRTIGTKRIYIPSFISQLSFYNATEPRMDIFFETYPFIPPIPTQLGWGEKILVFFLNHDAFAEPMLEEAPRGPDWGQEWGEAYSHILPLSYSGSDSNNILLVTDTAHDSNPPQPVQGIHAQDMDGNMLRVRASGNPELSTGDYVTIAYYKLSRWLVLQNKGYSLVATDKTRYYFTPSLQNSLPPTTPEIQAGFTTNESEGGEIRIEVSPSSDPDGLSRNITYEFLLKHDDDAASEWTPANIGWQGGVFSVPIIRSGNYIVRVRAIDEQGLRSEYAEAGVQTAVPQTVRLIAGEENSESAPPFDAVEIKTLGPTLYFRKSAQKITLPRSATLTRIQFALSMPPDAGEQLHMQASLQHADTNGLPDGIPIWTSETISNIPTYRNVCVYDLPLSDLSVAAGTYFLMLESVSESPSETARAYTHTIKYNSYPGSLHVLLNNGTEWQEFPDWDLFYRIYGRENNN